MPGAGIVDREPSGAAQTSAQNIAALLQKRILSVDQQVKFDLSLRDAKAQRLQLHGQPSHRDLIRCCSNANRGSSGPKCPQTPAGSGATTVRPAGVSQRSRR